jgi:hypothetical protein
LAKPLAKNSYGQYLLNLLKNWNSQMLFELNNGTHFNWRS